MRLSQEVLALREANEALRIDSFMYRERIAEMHDDRNRRMLVLDDLQRHLATIRPRSSDTMSAIASREIIDLVTRRLKEAR